MVDYLLEHVCDYVFDREPGIYHLAAVPMLVVLEQVDDGQHLMDVVPLDVDLLDYLLGHVYDHVVDREPGLYHLAAVPMLVVLEQVDDEH